MLSIAIAQIRSIADCTHNLQLCTSLALQASRQGAEVVFYPECSDIVFSQDYDKEGERKDPKNTRKFVEGMRAVARELGIWVIMGIHTEDPNDSEKWLNSAMTFSPTGSLVHKYDKIHPCVARFDEMDVDEQSSVTSGSSHQIGLSPLEITSRSGETWKIGVSICYDIRYPQFAAHHRRNGCDAIAYLTAWFPYTRSHWEPLMTARAIDNQCYVIAPGQYGQHDEERSSLGGSAILDPWGVKLVSLPQIQHDVPSKGDVKGHEEDQRPTAVGGRWEVVNGYDDAWIGYGQLKKEVIKEIRQGLPVWDFGRDEVYGSGMRSANGNSEESLNGSRDVE